MKNIKEDLKKILRNCLIQGLDIIKEQIQVDKENDWKWTFEYHDNYPSIHFFENKLPSFSLFNYSKLNYSKFLTKDKKYLEIPYWINYYEYVTNNEFLKKYLGIMEYAPFRKDVKEETIIIYNEIFTYHYLATFIDTYIHTESIEFEEVTFESLFNKYIESIIRKELKTTIIVPIIFGIFDFDEYAVNERISIKKIDTTIQLARNNRKSYTSSAHETVIGAATHAFYIRNWLIDNKTLKEREDILTDINAFNEPKHIIENLFASLRLVSDIDTGYCQIISLPDKWKYNGKAELPEIFVVSEKKYPDKFENYGWLNPINMIKQENLTNLKSTYDTLLTKQFILATKRLNSAFTRKNEEDSILDITIALESLLTNDSRAEITYRLAIRVSQLCKINKFFNYTPEQVFKLCKKIYDFRSAVVHGDLKKIEKNKLIKVVETKEIEIIEISIQLLKHIIKTMIEYKISDVKKIDKLML